jgi:tetratricopeptide (TPR) repeat protein
VKIRILGTILVVVLCAVALWAQTPEELLRSGRADELVQVLKHLTRSNPRDAQAWNLLSRAYLSVQKWDDAVTAGEKAVEVDPDNAEYHLWLGRAYGDKAEHSIFITAIRLAKRTRMEFERAVQLQSSNLDAQSDLAEFFIEAPAFLGGGKDKAEAQAEKLQSMDEATSHWIKARIAEKDNRADLAEKEYKSAISVAKKKAPYYLNLASFYRRNKKYNDMEQAINKAVASDRPHDDIFFESAQLLWRTGRNFPAAVSYLQRYLTSDDHVETAPTFEAHYLLGSLYEKMGNKQDAAKEYRAALQLASNYEPAVEGLKRVGP